MTLTKHREWVADCYQDSYTGAPVNDTARTKCSGSKKVLRGGGWNGHGDGLRAANRDYYVSGGFFDFLGFRLARSSPRVDP